MPTYPVINLETKEKRTVYDDETIISGEKTIPVGIKTGKSGCASAQEMFRWTGEAASSGWNEVLDRASKQPGATVRKNRDYSF